MTRISFKSPVDAYFPVIDRNWDDYAWNRNLIGADEGLAGRGGWHYQRSADHLHRGIDLKAPAGTPVVAVADGTVEFRSAFDDPAKIGFHYGGHRVYLVTRQFGSFCYFHLGFANEDIDSAAPAEIVSGCRTRVQAGDVIGYIGCSGGSVAARAKVPLDKSHLHFEHHALGFAGDDVNPKHLLKLCKTRRNVATCPHQADQFEHKRVA